MATEGSELTARQRQQILAQTRRREQVLGRGLRNAARKFFIAQAERVIKIWMDSGGYLSSAAEGEFKDPAQAMFGTGEDVRAAAMARPYVLEMTVTALNAAGELVGASSILGTDPMVLFLTDQSAQRVVKINDATRRGVQRSITMGQASGYSAYEIAYGSTATRKAGFRPIKHMVEQLYHGRPECIARTEMAYSNNGAALHRFNDMGLGQVEVSDGPGCALTHHVSGLKPGQSSPEDINGRAISMQEANAWQLAHPNCRRVFLPLRRAPSRPRARTQPPASFVTGAL